MCLKHATPVAHTVLVSGGFDGLKLWDVREKNCVRSLAHGGQGVQLRGVRRRRAARAACAARATLRA